MIKPILALFLLLTLPTNTLAQIYVCQPLNVKDEKNKGDHKHKRGTYLKIGLAHWQEDIFGHNSLTKWKGNLFGSDYNLTSMDIEIETYFDSTHLQLSGWSIGYRKDDLRLTDSGHILSGKIFRNFNLKVFELKPSFGIEWGMPSLNFDKTKFNYGEDGSTVSYEHTYPHRNFDLPVLGIIKNGVSYPFTELSLVQRPGPFLIEGGMRLNFIKFGVDDYEITNDKITYNFSSRRVITPYLFVNIGIKMF